LSAFAKDLEATIPALRRYARALTRDAEIADDLVQDTLVRALRSQHLFHGGDVRSWLYTILTNLNRNRLRSLARRPALSPLGDADAPQMAGQAAVEAWLAAHPEDAARVSTWRAQSESIKARYAGIALEPVPARLELARLRRLERRWTRAAAAAVIAAFLIGGLLGWFGREMVEGGSVLGKTLTTDAIDAHKLYVVEVRHP